LPPFQPEVAASAIPRDRACGHRRPDAL